MTHRQSTAGCSTGRKLLRRAAAMSAIAAVLLIVGCTKNASTGWAQTAPIIAAQVNDDPATELRLGG